MYKWWTKCGFPDCGKYFEVMIPNDVRERRVIESYFIKQHDVHLWPTRCKEHYVEPEPEIEDES